MSLFCIPLSRVWINSHNLEDAQEFNRKGKCQINYQQTKIRMYLPESVAQQVVDPPFKLRVSECLHLFSCRTKYLFMWVSKLNLSDLQMYLIPLPWVSAICIFKFFMSSTLTLHPPWSQVSKKLAPNEGTTVYFLNGEASEQQLQKIPGSSARSGRWYIPGY